MATTAGTSSDPGAELLRRIGARVRGRREERGWSRRLLAQLTGLSARFLAQLEAGEGNIAVTRLARVAEALELDLGWLVGRGRADGGPHRRLLALAGLRGAGKSSLGAWLAGELGVPFVEHDQLVEAQAGMELGELFTLHGEERYRELARLTLQRFLGEDRGPAVFAASGGIVNDPAAWRLLLDRAHVVWLRADPEEHLERVASQGDRRPMRDHPDALAAIRRLLELRGPEYARAPEALDTSALGLAGARERLLRLGRGAVGVPETDEG